MKVTVLFGGRSQVLEVAPEHTIVLTTKGWTCQDLGGSSPHPEGALRVQMNPAATCHFGLGPDRVRREIILDLNGPMPHLL